MIVIEQIIENIYYFERVKFCVTSLLVKLTYVILKEILSVDLFISHRIDSVQIYHHRWIIIVMPNYNISCEQLLEWSFLNLYILLLFLSDLHKLIIFNERKEKKNNLTLRITQFSNLERHKCETQWRNTK